MCLFRICPSPAPPCLSVGTLRMSFHSLWQKCFWYPAVQADTPSLLRSTGHEECRVSLKGILPTCFPPNGRDWSMSSPDWITKHFNLKVLLLCMGGAGVLGRRWLRCALRAQLLEAGVPSSGAGAGDRKPLATEVEQAIPKYGSVDTFPLIWIPLYKTFVKTCF